WRDEHVGELAVRARAAHDPALGDGLRAEPARLLFPADALGIAAADGAAGKEVALALERPALGGVGAEDAHDLVDEPLEDRIHLELSRKRLRRLEQRGLVAYAALVLVEERRGVQRDAELPGDGFDEGQLLVAPVGAPETMQREHAEDGVED